MHLNVNPHVYEVVLLSTESTSCQGQTRVKLVVQELQSNDSRTNVCEGRTAIHGCWGVVGERCVRCIKPHHEH